MQTSVIALLAAMVVAGDAKQHKRTHRHRGERKVLKHGSERSTHTFAQVNSKAVLDNTKCASVLVWKEGLTTHGVEVGHAAIWLGSKTGDHLPDDDTAYEYISWWPKYGTMGGERVPARPQTYGWDKYQEDGTFHKVDLCDCLDLTAMSTAYDAFAQHSFGYFEAQGHITAPDANGHTFTDAAHKAQETALYSFNMPAPSYSCSSMAVEMLKAGGAGSGKLPDMQAPTMGKLASFFMDGINSSDRVWKPSDVLTYAKLLLESGECRAGLPVTKHKKEKDGSVVMDTGKKKN